MHLRDRRASAIHGTTFVRPGEDRALEVEGAWHSLSAELVDHGRRPHPDRAVHHHQRICGGSTDDLRGLVCARDEVRAAEMTDGVLVWGSDIKQ